MNTIFLQTQFFYGGTHKNVRRSKHLKTNYIRGTKRGRHGQGPWTMHISETMIYFFYLSKFLFGLTKSNKEERYESYYWKTNVENNICKEWGP